MNTFDSGIIGQQPSILGGYRVVESLNLTIPGEPYEVKRTWKERLFSLPWQPLRKTYTVVPQIPSPEIIGDKINGVIYGHPETLKKMWTEARK